MIHYIKKKAVEKVVTLTSGGIDSCALNAYLAKELKTLVFTSPTLFSKDVITVKQHWQIYPVFFDYGQLSAHKEYESAVKFLHKIKIHNPLKVITIDNQSLKIPMTGYGRMPEVTDEDFKETKMKDWVPFRNLIFLTLAAQYASSIGASTLAIGSHQEPLFPFPDSDRHILNRIAEVLFLSDIHKQKWKILTPFIDIKWFKWDIIRWCNKNHISLKDTYTCYKGKKRHCGVCRGCQDRREAFKRAGVKDETEYE